MHLVNDISQAVPFGLQSSALRHAAEIAAAYEKAASPLATAMGIRPAITVIPYDAPYGPWWVIQVVAGAEVAFIADNMPALLEA